MKNMVLLLMSGFAGVLLAVLVLVFGGKLYRGEEAAAALPGAVEKSVEQTGINGENYGGHQLRAFCAESLALSMDSDSGLRMQVMKADREKGVLSIRLQEIFTHPNGGSDTAWEARTALLDQCVQEVPVRYVVRFYRNREALESRAAAYKICTVEEGNCMAPPAAPKEEGAAFAEWRDSNEYIADFSVPVTEDRVYYAVWEDVPSGTQ